MISSKYIKYKVSMKQEWEHPSFRGWPIWWAEKGKEAHINNTIFWSILIKFVTKFRYAIFICTHTCTDDEGELASAGASWVEQRYGLGA